MANIRIGIFGARRGGNFIPNILINNGDIVAVCDSDEKYLEEALKEVHGTAKGYTDFEEFINHPMDAVLIANFFPEHAKYSIRFLEKGVHVLSECLSNVTMAEGVRLVRAAEKSKAFFMLAENYPYMIFNQEMRKVYKGGTLGKSLYAEGEYNHPGNFYSTENQGLLNYYEKHWRNYLPRTYYITHSLAPLVYITGALPVRVSAVPVYHPQPADSPRVSRVPEAASIITCVNDDQSVYKVTGHSSFGAHSNSYRVCGEKGMMENVRGTDGMVMLRYNDWEIPEGREEVNYYKPAVVDENEEFIKKTGHGGGDYFVIKEFFNAISTNTKPEFDEYFATRLSSVAIMAHRSVLNGGIPFDVPDFSKEEDRVKFENDEESPFWLSDGTAPTMPCTVFSNYAPSELQIEKYRKALEESKNK